MSWLTITLPQSLLEAVDQKLVKEEENRSAVIRRLIEAALREVEERDDIDRYIRSYREQPQTDEEFGWSDQVTKDALAELPWQ